MRPVEAFLFTGEQLDRKGRPRRVTIRRRDPVRRRNHPDHLAIVVELDYDQDGPYAVGVTVRKDSRAGYKGGRTGFSGREIQRLPLIRYINAALAFATAEGGPGKQVLAAGAELVSPRPGSKPSLVWVAREYRRHTKDGRSPAKEIAAKLGVPVNRVYQWIHEARLAGTLEPSPRRR
jgi:hypothetical protein